MSTTLNSSPPILQRDSFRPVNVIVPIYRGISETRRCLESLLISQLPANCRVTLIDDCGPEPEMVELLAEFSSQPNFTLLRNSQNLGFVASVNRGMEYLPDHDPLLLNADTEVPCDWVQRLQNALYSAPDIGTVTPFSNNATICSYPRFCADNSLPAGINAVELDRLFHTVNAGQSIDIPTAVGFCMLIRRECLDVVGLFDVVRFGRGYGEENDFCMRAAHLGWRHVLCGDTFVYHAGAVSFETEHDARIRDALEILEQRHPDYSLLIRKHIFADPAARLRLRVDLLRISMAELPVILFVSHDLGGGVLRHIKELASQFEGRALFILMRAAAGHQIEISWCREGEGMRLFFHQDRDWPALCAFLRSIGILRIHFHHWLGLPEAIWQLPELCGVPYDVTIHDFHTICPRINLVDQSGGYCGEPVKAKCDRCLAQAPRISGDITRWRDQWHSRLAGAARLLAPSEDTASRMQHYFPDLASIVAPHPKSAGISPIPQQPHRDSSQPFTILAIGALSRIKGGTLIEECAQDAVARNLPLRFHLIGYAWRSLSAPADRLTVTGSYLDEDLPRLIGMADADIAWYPALWPETYSYTLSAALAAGLPIAVTNLGAPPERVGGRQWTWVCDWRWSAREWNDFFLAVRNRHFLTSIPPQPTSGNSQTAWDWSGGYLPISARILEPESANSLCFSEAHFQPRLTKIERELLRLRRAIFLVALRVRSHPALGRIIGMIPTELQHQLRRRILGQRI